MTTDAASTVRFGRLEQRGLLLGLSTAQIALAGSGVAIAVMAEFTAGAAGLLVSSPVWIGLVTLGTARIAGRRLVEWLPVTSMWAVRRSLGRTRQLRAPIRATDLLGLPGLPRSVTLTTSPDTGAALIRDARDSTVTAVLAVRGRGFLLEESGSQDHRVSTWGRVLAMLGQRRDIDRLQILHTQAPAHAVVARRWWADHVIDHAALPARLVAELLADAEDTTSQLHCWIAVALRAPRRSSTGGDVESSLTALADALRAADLEVGGWVTYRDLHRLLHRTYDPDGRCLDGDARSAAAHDGFAPMGVQESWSHLRTDSAFHSVYWISEWPRADVPPSFLQPLLLAPGAARSFSLLLEPLPVSEAMRDIRRAKVELAADSSQRYRIGRVEDESARAEADDVARRERELLAGHGDLRFTGLVTVTASTLEGLAEACRATEAAAARSMCELRLLVGQQAAAHAAAALPFARSAS